MNLIDALENDGWSVFRVHTVRQYNQASVAVAVSPNKETVRLAIIINGRETSIPLTIGAMASFLKGFKALIS